jgi:hypothetical protein
VRLRTLAHFVSDTTAFVRRCRALFCERMRRRIPWGVVARCAALALHCPPRQREDEVPRSPLDALDAFERALGEGERLRRSVPRELDIVRRVHAMDTFEWNEVLAGAGVQWGTIAGDPPVT